MENRGLKELEGGQGCLPTGKDARQPCYGSFCDFAVQMKASCQILQPHPLLTLGVPSWCQHSDGASHPHLCGICGLVGHVSSRAGRWAQRRKKMRKNRAQLLFLHSLFLKRGTSEGAGFIEAPPFSPLPLAPATTHSNNSTKYTSGPVHHLQGTVPERQTHDAHVMGSSYTGSVTSN